MELIGVDAFEFSKSNDNVPRQNYLYPSAVLDPYAWVVSANIRRRHLTGEQKRDIIAKLLKATPDKSNNAIAKTIGVDDKTVGKVRDEMVGRSGSRTSRPARILPAARSRRTSPGSSSQSLTGARRCRWRRRAMECTSLF